MKALVISKDGVVKCTTTVTNPYPKDVIKCMKNAGYKLKEVIIDDNEKSGTSSDFPVEQV